MNNNGASYCVACGGGINERFYLQVGVKHLHNACLSCKRCLLSLSSAGSCYEKKGDIYCKECYFKYVSLIPKLLWLWWNRVVYKFYSFVI